ncbi:MAG: hypothetical protein ACTSWL_00045, partial [Promethearchaeota archaeon]
MVLKTNNSAQKIIEKIRTLISSKHYDNTVPKIDDLFNFALEHRDEELLMNGLVIINSICDKTKSTIKYSLERMNQLLDNEEAWIRVDALNILRKLFPVATSENFEPLIEKCEVKLFDSDKKVREAAINLIAKILHSSYTIYPELYTSYTRMFDDKSWKIRAQTLVGTLSFLDSTQIPPSDLIEIISQKIPTLLRDPDEEIRGLASEVLKTLCNYLSAENITSLLLPILNDINWEIREKGIWIAGEIQISNFEDFHLLFQNLIALFNDEIMIIQTKTVDTFVKIGRKQGYQLLEFFIPFIISLESQKKHKNDQEEGISDSLIYISIENMREMLPLLMEQLHHPKVIVRSIIGNCLVKIYMEKPDLFEDELFKIFQSLNPEDWRQRKKIIGLLGDLCYILHIESVAVWTTINFNNWQNKEKDVDVREEIQTSLEKIHNIFPDINEKINEIKERKQKFYEGIESFTILIQTLRKQTQDLIKDKKFYDAEIFLEEEGNKISEKLDEYEYTLQESEFRRFSVELIQDFQDNKEEILENISDLKSALFNQICDGRAEYLEKLQGTLSDLRNRIDVVKAEYETVKDNEKELDDKIKQNDPILIEDFLKSLSNIRNNLYSLEFDMGQTWLSNLEFKEFLKEITIYWVDVKIEIQQYLANIFHKFSLLQIDVNNKDQKYSKLRQKITRNFLNDNLQKVILQAVQAQRDVLERFNQITTPIYKELRKRNFSEARHLVDLTSNNLYTSIENYNKEINKIYQDFDKIEISSNNSNNGNTSEGIRKSLDHWTDIKEEILNRIREFNSEIDKKIIIGEIKEYLKFMNPLP